MVFLQRDPAQRPSVDGRHDAAASRTCWPPSGRSGVFVPPELSIFTARRHRSVGPL